MKQIKKNHQLLLVMILLIAAGLTRCGMGEEVMPEGIDEIGSSSSKAFNSCDCDYVVKGYFNDGKKMNLKPGDVICLEGNKTYNRLLFQNIIGTEGDPIIIKNCGGVAAISSKNAFGIKFEHSKHFKLMGNGSGDKYGIKVSTDVGFYLSMERFTTNFEISNVEIAGTKQNGIGDRAGFAGISVKTSPYQDCDLFADRSRTSWTMRDIMIKNNYIHDTGGEGLYIGHGFYTGRKESRCSNVTYSHSIRGLTIKHNLIEDVGYDGVQIKNADHDVNVHDNIIRNSGNRNKNGQNEGLFIGEGTVGTFYNNFIDGGSGNGIMIHGLGNLAIYNNVVVKSGKNGIFAANGEYVTRINNGYFYFANNTICDAKDYGFMFFGKGGGHKAFVNNLVVNTKKYAKAVDVDMESNIYVKQIDNAGFVDYRNKDFHLNSSSVAKDKGYDLRPYALLEDFDGKPRPQGGKFDVGAFEH